MTDETYKELHYRADVTAMSTPDSLLGCDSFGRPYRVISADFDGDTTVVVLAYARAEDVIDHNTRAAEQNPTAQRIRALFAGSVPT